MLSEKADWQCFTTFPECTHFNEALTRYSSSQVKASIKCFTTPGQMIIFQELRAVQMFCALHCILKILGGRSNGVIRPRSLKELPGLT